MCVYDDGSGPALYAVGGFNAAGGMLGGKLARLDGERFVSLAEATAPSELVLACVVFDDGISTELYIAGSFSTFGGVACASVVKWNGVRFAPVGSLHNAIITDLTVFDDGTGAKLYACGNIPADPMAGVGGGIRVLNGGTWGDVDGGINGVVTTMEVWDDGQGECLYIGGLLQDTSLQSRPLARFDGTHITFPNASFSSAVIADLQSFSDVDGVERLYCVGTFQQPMMAIRGLVSFDGTSFSFPPNTQSIIVGTRLTRSDVTGTSRLVIGTQLPYVGSSTVSVYDGVSLSPLGVGGPSSQVASLISADFGQGERVIASGSFMINGTQSGFVGFFDGSAWSSFANPTGTNRIVGNVYAIDADDDGTLYFGGDFGLLNGPLQQGVRAARYDGMSISGLGAGLNGVAFAIEPFGGDDIYFGGTFTASGATPIVRIGRWDGSAWHAVGGGVSSPIPFPGLPAQVFALTRYSPPAQCESLVVAGDFQLAGGLTANNVALWNGTTWATLGTGVGGVVGAACVFDDGSGPALYVAGVFATAGGAPASNIAKWNGTTWSALGSGTNGPVYALAVHDDGSGPALYAGGQFLMAGGIASPRIARWNGSAWSGVAGGIPSVFGASPPTLNAVYSLSSFFDGHRSLLSIGGSFLNVQGVQANGVAFYDGSGFIVPPTTPSFVPSNPPVVYALHGIDTTTGPSLLVGGLFLGQGNVIANNLAAWVPDDSSPACVSLGAAADGNVGVNLGDAERVLEINGYNGGLSHRVNVGVNESIAIAVDAPQSAPFGAAFTLFGWLDAADASLETALPLGLGTMVIPPCAGAAPSLAFTLADSFGFGSLICPPLVPSTPAPWMLAHPGLPVFARIILQGVIQDPSAPLGISVTNGIVLVIGN